MYKYALAISLWIFFVSIISATFLFDNAVFLSCSCISCDKWHYLIWSTLELLRACVTNHSFSFANYATLHVSAIQCDLYLL